MLATASSEVYVGVIYTVIAALVIGIARAGVQTQRKRQTTARDDASLREYFFDTPANTRTGVPEKKGWTTKVDQTLSDLGDSQKRVERAVHDIRNEVKPDGNGGHNLRGDVRRAAAAADAEVQRVHRQEDGGT